MASGRDGFRRKATFIKFNQFSQRNNSFFRDVGHCRVRPFHVKHSEFTPNTGAIHEKTNLDCDCGNLNCSGCHLQWNEGGYCPTDPTVSSWGFPYHPAPDVGVEALRQNQRAAAR
jgi:hypothetical protein